MVKSPRLTVSGQIVDRSTVGAAGLSRETATTATVNSTAATPAYIAYWRIFFFFRSGRAISITSGYSTCHAKGAPSLIIEKKALQAGPKPGYHNPTDRFCFPGVRYRTVRVGSGFMGRTTKKLSS